MYTTGVLHAYKVSGQAGMKLSTCIHTTYVVILLLNFEHKGYCIEVTIYRAASGILRYLLFNSNQRSASKRRNSHHTACYIYGGTLQNQSAKWAHFSKNGLLRELWSMCASCQHRVVAIRCTVAVSIYKSVGLHIRPISPNYLCSAKVHRPQFDDVTCGIQSPFLLMTYTSRFKLYGAGSWDEYELRCVHISWAYNRTAVL